MAKHRLPIYRFKSDKKKKPQPVRNPEVGSVWVPGVTDGSWLWPDSAHVHAEKGSDGVTRLVRD